MSTELVRLIFAALCGVCFFSIGGAAAWEWIRFRRGESALTARHFRWRMLSALTWLVILGSFFVATVFMWPPTNRVLTEADKVLAKRFVLVTSGATLLMLLGFGLMAIDVFWTIQVGRRSIQERARQRQRAMQKQMNSERTGQSSPPIDSNGHLLD